MRFSLRAAGLFVVAFAAITCTDSTGPSTDRSSTLTPGRLAMSPSFSPEAARAYGALSQFGLEITEVRVRLTAANGSVRDTVILFPVGQDTLRIEIPVPVEGTDQTFTALLELRTADHVVLFSGTQTVTARASNLPPTTPPVVTIQYSGPGRTLRNLSVAPADTTLRGASSGPFRVAGTDAAGAAVTDLLVAWNSSDPTVATVVSSGNATATVTASGRRGSITLTATSATGVAAVTRVSLVPAAARIVVVSGGAQNGIAGRALAQPFVVEVQGTDNLPLPLVPVTFRAVTSGGSVATASAVTDANGRASTAMTLGRTTGSYQFEAASGTLTPATVSATAAPAPVSGIAIVSGDAQADSLDRALAQPLVVRVSDDIGAPVTGATVSFARIAGIGVLGTASAVTGADGLASTTYTLGSIVRTDSVSATVSGAAGVATVTFTMRAIPRGPALLLIVGGAGQSGTAGAALPLPLSVRATDAGNRPVAGVSVAWTATTGSATFLPAASVTGADGTASTVATLGAAAGSVVVRASSGVLSASATLTSVAGAANKLVVVTSLPPTISVGGALSPVSVRLADASGNPVLSAGVVVTGTGTVTPSAGAPATITATTDATGTATFALPPYVGPTGTLTLSLSAPGVTPVTIGPIPIVRGPAAQLKVIATPASASTGVAFAAQPVVRIADVGGNFTSSGGVVVTASLASGTGTLGGTLTATTDTSGTARFTSLAITGPAGPYTIGFAATGLAAATSQPIALGAGTPTQMSIFAGSAQTAPVGTVLPVAPAVRLLDAGGNPVPAVSVLFTVTTGGGSVTAATATTDALGVAAVGSWTLGATVGGNSITATSGSLSTVITATAVAGAAARLSAVAMPATATSGALLSPQPSMRLVDAGGNPVATAGVIVTAALASGGGTLGGTLTAATNAAGVASFTDLAITGTTGSYTLSFASSGATSFTTAAIPLGSGAGSRIVLALPLPASITVGNAPSTASVQLSDVSGNPVSAAGVTVTMTGTVPTTPTAFTFSLAAVSDAGGLATFALPSYSGPVGQLTLVFSASGYSSLSAAPLTVLVGPAAKLGISGGPTTALSGAVLSPALIVRLSDVGNNFVAAAGISVSASIFSGGGTLSGTTTVNSDASGTATFTNLEIAGTPGPRVLSFSAPTLTGVNGAPITLGAGAPAAMLIVAGQGQTAQVGTNVAVPPSVRIVDAGGIGVAGVTVSFAPRSGGKINGAISSVNVVTDASGLATVPNWTLGTAAAANSDTLSALTIGVTGSPALFVATATAGAPSVLALTTPPPASAQSGVVLGTAPVIQLRDGSGNPVSLPGVPVVATMGSGGGTLRGTMTVTTNAGGQATFTDLSILGPVASPKTIVFNATGYTSVTSPTITLSAGSPAVMAKSSSDSASVTAGTVVPGTPAVTVSDSAGNPVAGVTVTFAVTAGGGSVTGATPSTNASGLATLGSWQVGAAPGVNTLTATAGALTATFTATGTTGAATKLLLLTAPPATVTVGAGAVGARVQLADALGNPVLAAGVVITGSGVVTPGPGSFTITATTDAAGIATFALPAYVGTAGTLTITANALTLPGFTPLVLSPITALVGAPAKLGIFGGPTSAASGAALAPAVVVRVGDVGNNFVSAGGITVVATIDSGGGTLTGTMSVTTDTGGVARFTNLVISGTAGVRKLRFSATPLIDIISPAIAVSAGTPASVIAISGQGQTATVGTNVSMAPSLRVFDAGGVGVPGINVTFTPKNGGQVGGSVASVTVVTDGSGLAVAPSWTLGAVAAANSDTLVATVAASPFSVTFVATATSVAPPTLALTTLTPGSSPSGAVFATAPVVQLRDGAGSPLALPGVVVTAQVGSGGAALGGDSIVTTNAAGQAVFNNLSIAGLIATPKTIVFNATGYSPVKSTITLTTGVAAIILKASVDSQTTGATYGIPVRPTVKVTDSAGNPVTGAPVTFAVTSGGGFLSFPTPTTNATGQAQVGNWFLGSAIGTNTVSATSGALTVSFTAFGTLSYKFGSFSVGANSSVAGNPFASGLSLPVLDNTGAPAVGTAVTFKVKTPAGVVVQTLTIPADVGGNAAITPAQMIIPYAAGNPWQLQATIDAYPGPTVTRVYVVSAAGGTQPLLNRLSLSTSNLVIGAPGASWGVEVGNATAATIAGPFTLQGWITQGATTRAAGGTSLTCPGPTTNLPVGACPATFSFSASNGASGSGTLVPGAADFRLDLQNGSGSVVASATTAITLGVGPATSMIALAAGPFSATNGATVATWPSVRVVDAFGNRAAGETVDASLADPTAATQTFSVTTDGNGEAVLQPPAVTALSVVGAWTMSATSPGIPGAPLAFVINVAASVPVPQLLRGPAVLPRITGALNSTNVGGSLLGFEVLDSAGTRIGGIPVRLSVLSGSKCTVSGSPTLSSDANGLVNATGLSFTNEPGACVLKAEADGVSGAVHIQAASYPLNATHVWFGEGAGSSSTSPWEGSANWIAVNGMTAGSTPSSSSSDEAFIPSWGGFGYTWPKIMGTYLTNPTRVSIHRLHMEPNATLDLGGLNLLVYGDSSGSRNSVRAIGAQVTNGKLAVYGAGAMVYGGIYDQLSVGGIATSNVCNSNTVAARLRNLAAGSLEVHCKVVVDSTVVVTGTTTSFLSDALNSAYLIVDGTTSLLTTGTATFNGDSVAVRNGGAIAVSGTAFFGGDSLKVSSAGVISVTGASTFRTRTRLRDANSLMALTGAALFDRSGLFTEGDILSQSSITFDGNGSGGYGATSGNLFLEGNLVQTGTSPSAPVFAASGTHTLQVVGGANQTITFAQPTSARLATVLVAAGATTTTLGSDLVADTIRIQSGTLALNTHQATVTTFRTLGIGTLTMTNATDSLRITGDASFDGANQTGRLTNGAITFGGNFSQGDAGGHQKSYVATSTHLSRFTGVARTIIFASAEDSTSAAVGSLSSRSRFGALEVRSGSSVTFQTNAYVGGNAIMNGSGTIPLGKRLIVTGNLTGIGSITNLSVSPFGLQVLGSCGISVGGVGLTVNAAGAPLTCVP